MSDALCIAWPLFPQACQPAFDHLKKALTEALAVPDFSKPFVVDTDGCTSSEGAVLSQLGSKG